MKDWNMFAGPFEYGDEQETAGRSITEVNPYLGPPIVGPAEPAEEVALPTPSGLPDADLLEPKPVGPDMTPYMGVGNWRTWAERDVPVPEAERESDYLGGLADLARGMARGVPEIPAMAGRTAEFAGRNVGGPEEEEFGAHLGTLGERMEEKYPWLLRESEEGRAIEDPLSFRGQMYETGESLVTSLGPAAVGAATGAAIGSVVPGIGTAMGLGVGALVGFFGSIPMFSGSQGAETYDRTYKHQTETLKKSPEEAHAEALEAGWINAGIEAGGETLSSLVTAGAARLIPRRIRRGIIDELAKNLGSNKGVRSLMDNEGAYWRAVKDIALKVIPTEMATEIGQAMSQQYVESIYAGAEVPGADTALQVIIPTMVTAGLAGAGAHTIGGMDRADIARVLADPNENEVVRANAAGRVEVYLRKQDRELADIWHRYADEAISNRRPMVAREDSFYRNWGPEMAAEELAADERQAREEAARDEQAVPPADAGRVPVEDEAEEVVGEEGPEAGIEEVPATVEDAIIASPMADPRVTQAALAALGAGADSSRVRDVALADPATSPPDVKIRELNRLRQEAEKANAEQIQEAGEPDAGLQQPRGAEVGDEERREVPAAEGGEGVREGGQAGVEAGEVEPSGAAEDIEQAVGDFGGGIVESLYDGLFDSLEKGSDRFAGHKDPVLTWAKPAYDAGRIKTAEDLRRAVTAGYPGTPSLEVTSEIGEVEQSLVSPAAEPPVPAGTVRFYYGGLPYDRGSRRLFSDRRYAEDDAKGTEGAIVQYVDIPADSPLLYRTFDDTGYADFYAPEELASRLRPLQPPAVEAEEPPMTGEEARRGLVRLRPEDIELDPERFQFRTGVDETGDTGRLRGVSEWDAGAAGRVLVWQADDGTYYAADGHHRVNLAKRLKAEGHDINLDVEVLREEDGVSEADARTIAAVRNLQGGNIDAIDVARLFREVGDEGRQAIMPRVPGVGNAAIRDGEALATLNDEAFALVNADAVPANHAAEVARTLEDDSHRLAALGYLQRNPAANAGQARMVAEQMRDADFAARAETGQADMFGGDALEESLFLERAKVIDAAVAALRRDKAVFKTLQREADRIEETGNVLERQANIARASEAERMTELLRMQANVRGDISDAISNAAQAVRDGTHPGVAARGVVDAVRQSLGERQEGAGVAAPGGRLPQGAEEGATEVRTEAVAGAGEGGDVVPPALELETQTEADIAAREEQERQRVQVTAEEEARARADEQREGFTLTGSTLPADEAIAAGAMPLDLEPVSYTAPPESLVTPPERPATVPDTTPEAGQPTGQEFQAELDEINAKLEAIRAIDDGKGSQAERVEGIAKVAYGDDVSARRDITGWKVLRNGDEIASLGQNYDELLDRLLAHKPDRHSPFARKSFLEKKLGLQPVAVEPKKLSVGKHNRQVRAAIKKGEPLYARDKDGTMTPVEGTASVKPRARVADFAVEGGQDSRFDLKDLYTAKQVREELGEEPSGAIPTPEAPAAPEMAEGEEVAEGTAPEVAVPPAPESETQQPQGAESILEEEKTEVEVNAEREPEPDRGAVGGHRAGERVDEEVQAPDVGDVPQPGQRGGTRGGARGDERGLQEGDTRDTGPRGTEGTRVSGSRRAGARRGPASPPGRVSGEGRKVTDSTVSGKAEESEARGEESGANFNLDDMELGKGGPLAKTRANLEALRIVKALQAEKRRPTPTEQATVARYIGFGDVRIRQQLFPVGRQPTGSWAEIRGELEAMLTDAELAEVKSSTRFAHYTSKEVVQAVWSGLQRLGATRGIAFEAGVGSGNFPGLMPAEMALRYQGVEREPIAAGVAKALYPNHGITHADFMNVALPENHFDVVVGNPPFSSNTVKADKNYAGLGFSLHNYFIAKQIDALRPGGVGAFVVSHYLMDAKDSKARDYIAARADLVGAIRLPNTAFKENAGTSVVIDVLFFRKRQPDVATRRRGRAAIQRGETRGGQDWVEVKETTIQGEPTEINEYFVDNPQMVLGDNSLEGEMTAQEREYTVKPRSGEASSEGLARAMDRALSALPENLYAWNVERDVDTRLERYELAPEASDGSFYLRDDGSVWQVSGGIGGQVPSAKRGRAKAYIPLREAVLKVFRAQAADEESTAAQKEMMTAWTAFTKAYGPLNQEKTITRKDGKEQTRTPNETALSMDPEFFRVQAIERYDQVTGTARPGPIFTEKIVGKEVEPEAESAADAAAISLNKRGRLDMDYMRELYQVDVETMESELGDSVYRDPISGGLVPRDQYLSGNVKAKLAAAKDATKRDEAFQRNVEALEAAQPRDIGAGEIRYPLGGTWVPADTVHAFANDVMDFDGTVNSWHGAGASGWVVNGESRDDSLYGTARASAASLLNAALNKTRVVIKDPGKRRDDPPTVNKEETAAANQKIQDLNDGFDSWVKANPEHLEALAEIFNDTMNVSVPWVPDGSHLSLPGFTSRYTPHPWQKNLAWRFAVRGNTYAAHEVGAGKTLATAITVMEARRLGLVKMAAVAVPKSTLSQWRNEWLDAYPNANLLTISTADLNAKGRRRFWARAASGDYDAIIVTHHAFKSLGLQPETTERILREDVRELEAVLDEMESMEDRSESGPPGKSPTRSQIEAARDRIEQTIAKAQAQERDAGVTFEELGADMLVIDEAHNHKKMGFATSQSDIKGVDGDHSDMGLDLYTKSRYLREVNPQRSLLMLSGTPITNSIGEIFMVQRLMQPDVLERTGTDSFDSWSATFAGVKTELATTAGGSFKPDSRMISVHNRAGLVKDLHSALDIVDQSDLIDSGVVNLPDVKGGGRSVELVPESDDYAAYQDELAARISAYEKMPVRERKRPGADNIPWIMSDGAMAAIDLRLVGREPTTPTKLDVAAERIAAIYEEHKGDEFVTDGMADSARGGLQLIFSDLWRKRFEDGREFDGADYLRNRLVALGVPRSEILNVKDLGQDERKRKRAWRDANAGKYAVLIGGTQTLGTGVNVQKRAVAAHHLDVPLRPDSIVQREGRIVRNGNQYAAKGVDVEIYAWAKEGSIEAFNWQLNENKQRMIDSAMNKRDLTTMSIDELDSSADQMAMAMAMVTGDPRVLERAKLQSDVRRLQSLEQAHHSQVANISRQLKNARNVLAGLREAEPKWEAAAAKVVDTRGDKFAMTVGTRSFTERSDAARALAGYMESIESDGWAKNAGREVATIGGLPVLTAGAFKGWLNVGDLPEFTRIGEQHAVGSDVYTSTGKPLGMISRLESRVRSIKSTAGEFPAEIAKAEKVVTQRERQAEKPQVFQHSAKLADSRARLSELDAELAPPEPPEAEDGGSAADESETRFNLAEGAVRRGTAPSRNTLQEWLTEVSRNWTGLNVPLHAVASESDLPGSVQVKLSAAREANPNVYPKAVFVQGDGVYLIANNLSGVRDAQRVLGEEVFGHFGLRKTLGERMDPILDQVADERSAEVAKLAKDYGLDMERTAERREAAEEYLAHLAQSRRNTDMPLLKRLIAAVRSLLRSVGFRFRLSDNDIRAMLAASRRHVERSGKNEKRTETDARFSLKMPSLGERSGVPTFGDIAKRNRFLVRHEIVTAENADVVPLSFRDGSAAGWEIKYPGNEDIIVTTSVDMDGGHASTYLENYAEFGTNKGTGVGTTLVLRGMMEAQAEGVNGYESDSIMSDEVRAIYQRLISVGVPFLFDKGQYKLTKKQLQEVDFAAAESKLWESALNKKGKSLADIPSEEGALSQPRVSFLPVENDVRGEEGVVRFSLGGAQNVRDLTQGIWNYLHDRLGPTKVKSVGWWNKSVGTPFHLAQKEPWFKAVYDNLTNYMSEVSARSTDAESLAPNMFLKMEGFIKAGKSAYRVARKTREKRLSPVEQVINETQVLEHGDPMKRVLSPEELKQRGLDDEQIATYNQNLKAAHHMLDGTAQTVMANNVRALVEQLSGHLTRKGRRLAGKDAAMAVLDDDVVAASDVAREVVAPYQDAIQDYLNATNGMLADAKTELRAMRKKGDKKGVEQAKDKVSGLEREAAKASKLLKAVDDTLMSVDAVAEKVVNLKKEAYFPLMRFGKYTLTVWRETETEGGYADMVEGAAPKTEREVVYYGQYQTEAQQKEARRDLEAKLKDGEDIVAGVRNEIAWRQFQGLNMDVLAMFADNIETRSKAGAEQAELMREYIRLAAADNSALKRQLKRKGTPGYSRDLQRVLASFIISNSRLASSNLHMGDVRRSVDEIPQTKGDLQEYGQRLMEYVQNPGEEFAGLRAFMFTWYLGGSVASALVNLTQVPMMTYPYLLQFKGANAGTILDAYKEAFGEIKDETLKDAVHQAALEGHIAPQEMYALMATARGGPLGGSSIKVMSHPYAKLGVHLWGSFFSLAEQFNRRVSFIAGYRVAQAQGKKGKAAYDAAVETVEQTQLIYRKENRPQWARGVTAPLFTFKLFTIQYLEFIKRLPPKPRAAALGLLVLAAGLQGLPGEEDMEDLIDTLAQWFGYNTQSRDWLESAVENTIGTVAAAVAGEEAGDFATRFALKGVSELGLPFDVQARLGMGDIVPGSRILAPDKAGRAGEITDVAGPAAGLAKDIASAAESFARGQPERVGYYLLPQAVKNVLDGSFAMREGFYRDRQERPVLDVSGMEAAFKTIGLQPRAVARHQEQKYRLVRRDAHRRAMEDAFLDRMAIAISRDRRGDLEAARRDLKAWNRRNPDDQIRYRRAQIKRRVQALQQTSSERFLRTLSPELRAEAAAVLR